MRAVIYVRTSTIEQHPENQIADCLEFAKARGYELIDEPLQERLSGFKQIDRPQYEKVKELARTGKIQAVIVWALDRWIRNRDTLLEDITTLRNYGVKIHSVKEAWLEAINIEGSLGKTIQEFLLGLIGSLAEMESQRKSERIKIAFINHKGTWGRKNMNQRVNDEIIDLRKKGMSLREIAQSVFYYDKNHNKKQISLAYVHKTIKRGNVKLQ